MGQHCGDGNCKMVVTTEAFGLTRDVVYDGGQRRWLLRRYQCCRPRSTG